MRFILFYSFLLVALTTCAQPIVYVTESGRGDGSGTSWSNALPGTSLPERLAAATVGTQFWLTGGTYKPTTTTDRLVSFRIASGVSMYGGFRGNEASIQQRTYQDITYDNPSILSGKLDNQHRSIRVVTISNATQPITLDGLVIADGYAAPSDPSSLGSGLFIEQYLKGQLNLTISTCRFSNNVLLHNQTVGGAIGIDTFFEGDVIMSVSNSTFSANEAGNGGAFGTIFAGTRLAVSFDDCLFTNNVGQTGAGAINYTSYNPSTPTYTLTVRNSRFSANRGNYTGAAMVASGPLLTVDRCLFDNNWVAYYSPYGGGGAVETSACTNAQFSNCLFYNNSAYRGGVLYSSSVIRPTRQTFVNCTFANNKASVTGGVFYTDHFGATQPGNTANPNQTFLTNCILWGNTAPLAPVFRAEQTTTHSSQPVTSYSIIQDFTARDYPGSGNSASNPLFIAPELGNFRLKPASPAINVGDSNRGDFLSTTDLDGNPRLRGGRVDIGAYEFDCDLRGCTPFMVRRSK